MGISDFSSVDQWAPYARQTLRQHGNGASGGGTDNSGVMAVFHQLVCLPLSLLPKGLRRG